MNKHIRDVGKFNQKILEIKNKVSNLNMTDKEVFLLTSKQLDHVLEEYIQEIIKETPP